MCFSQEEIVCLVFLGSPLGAAATPGRCPATVSVNRIKIPRGCVFNEVLVRFASGPPSESQTGIHWEFNPQRVGRAWLPRIKTGIMAEDIQGWAAAAAAAAIPPGAPPLPQAFLVIQ